MKTATKAFPLILAVVFVCCRLAASQEEEVDPIAEEYVAKFRDAFKQANISEKDVTIEAPKLNLGLDFNCPTALPSNYKPAESVHALTPYDISIVAGMGDSVTAAMGAGARSLLTDLIEYRGLSWSIGGDGDIRSVTTLPNILEEYSSEVKGYATGISILTTKKLSVAKSGAKAPGMLGQAEALVEKMDKMFGSREEVDSKWKIITLWIGGNDLCAICGGSAEEHAQKYEERLERALDYLSNNVKRAFVNLVLIVDVTELAKIHDLVCDLSHIVACTCVDIAKKVISDSSRLYNKNLQSLMETKNFYNREDFTVVLQPFFSNTKLPEENKKQYFAPDCFHFNRDGHAVGAMYLWNNMLEPVGTKTEFIDWENLGTFKCPTSEAPYFYTSVNSKNALLNSNSGDEGFNRGSSNFPAILAGSLVAMATVAVVVVLISLFFVRRKRKIATENLEKLKLISVQL